MYVSFENLNMKFVNLLSHKKITTTCVSQYLSTFQKCSIVSSKKSAIIQFAENKVQENTTMQLLIVLTVCLGLANSMTLGKYGYIILKWFYSEIPHKNGTPSNTIIVSRLTLYYVLCRSTLCFALLLWLFRMFIKWRVVLSLNKVYWSSTPNKMLKRCTNLLQNQTNWLTLRCSVELTVVDCWAFWLNDWKFA